MMSLPVHHVGRTVSNLERSAEFYMLFGGEEVAAEHFCGPQFGKALGFDHADFNMKMVQVGDLYIELLCYAVPEGNQSYTSRNCDVGAGHFAFQVDDIFEEYERFVRLGVGSYSAPQKITEGAFAGGAFVYLKDPDGLPVELVQLPKDAA
jgi:catechol 2,3-dioxygenase-like lactoylglutathione lyase family enzyme